MLVTLVVGLGTMFKLRKSRRQIMTHRKRNTVVFVCNMCKLVKNNSEEWFDESASNISLVQIVDHMTPQLTVPKITSAKGASE